MQQEKYKYRGMEINTHIAKELIRQLCSGKTMKRGKICDTVMDYHKKNGGDTYLRADETLKDATKGALRSLKKEGIAENIAKGNWTIKENSSMSNNKAIVIGEGEQEINLYFIDPYLEYRELLSSKKLYWRIKKSEEKIETGVPGEKIIRFIIKTNNSVELQKLIIEILRWKRLEHEEGWFLATEEQINKIITLLME